MKEQQVLLGIGAYLLIVSLAAVILTVTDKVRAAKHKWRIAESTLLLVALFGGAVSGFPPCLVRASQGEIRLVLQKGGSFLGSLSHGKRRVIAPHVVAKVEQNGAYVVGLGQC